MQPHELLALLASVAQSTTICGEGGTIVDASYDGDNDSGSVIFTIRNQDGTTVEYLISSADVHVVEDEPEAVCENCGAPCEYHSELCLCPKCLAESGQ